MNNKLTILFYHEHVTDDDVTFLLYMDYNYADFMDFDYENYLSELSYE